MNVMSSIPATGSAPPADDALWYKDAIIYQLHVKAFADSNTDGIGDFAGLTERLDYLQDLGVTPGTRVGLCLPNTPYYVTQGPDNNMWVAIGSATEASDVAEARLIMYATTSSLAEMRAALLLTVSTGQLLAAVVGSETMVIAPGVSE